MKTICFSLLLLIFVSCGKKGDLTNSDETLEKNATFFGIVYKTTASRVIGTTNWVAVSGIQRLLINHSGNSTDTSTGSFIVQYENYKEPQLYNTSLCSGGFEGEIVITEVSNEQNTTDVSTIYDPSSTYTGDTTSNNNNTSTGEIDPITGEAILPAYYSFEFGFTVNKRSMSAGCTSIYPLSSFNMSVTRFTNSGDLIVKYPNRGIEFYMQPQLQ